MANCPQCQGLLMDDALEGDVKCSSCGRRYEKPKGRDPGAQAGALQITVTPGAASHMAQGRVVYPEVAVKIIEDLEPKTLPELYTAIAQTKGMTGNAYLQSLGINPGAASHMAQGRVVYPEVAVKIIEDLCAMAV